jgi:hypothetical protein
LTDDVESGRRRAAQVMEVQIGAGLPERVIAEIMGWEEDYVGRIIRRCVDRGAATRAIIRQLNRKRT